jgi:lysozyme
VIIERLRETLKRDEGFDLKRHEVQGIDHIGYGINLEQELPDELLQYLGVEAEDAIQEITQEQADYLLEYYVEVAEGDCKTIYGDIWQRLSPLRQEVLINLAFNLGLPRLKAFRKMNAAIRAEDWTEAAAQMLDSKAARQTGGRYQRLAQAFETDVEKHLELQDVYDQPTVRKGELADFSDAELLEELSRRLLSI